jgi:hypothetical protein
VSRRIGRCPTCTKGLEFQVWAGAIEFGYTYWAGSMHLDVVSDHHVRGLRRVDGDGTAAVELDGVVYRFRATS